MVSLTLHRCNSLRWKTFNAVGRQSRLASDGAGCPRFAPAFGANLGYESPTSTNALARLRATVEPMAHTSRGPYLPSFGRCGTFVRAADELELGFASPTMT